MACRPIRCMWPSTRAVEDGPVKWKILRYNRAGDSLIGAGSTWQAAWDDAARRLELETPHRDLVARIGRLVEGAVSNPKESLAEEGLLD